VKNKIESLFELPIIRYIFVGGISFFIEISFIYLLIAIGFNEVLAVAIGFWLGFIIAFILQKIFAFKDTAKKIKHVAKQTMLYSALVCINYAFTVLGVAILYPILGLFISRTLILLITTGWNYVIYKKVIFKTAN
jgi:putative flippase GtrA